ncbi:P-loop containing nucleoside triphosphate hydrolase protein [Dentipellis sp. KUC8613]|nr:P-loop containing nucleoside triphosphate hydrolase protein [Dentipellis sp. KUC8613]
MCLVSGLTRGLWTAHISSKEHRRRAAAQGVSVDVEPIEAGAPRHSRICDPCNTVVFDNQWSNHLRGRVHAKSVRFQAYKAVYGEAAKDKHGVTISHAEKGINFDVVASADALRGVQQSLVIRATDRQPQVSIIDLKWSSSISGKTSPSFTTTAGSMPLRLESSAETCITVTFRQPAVLIGRYEDKLEITFQDESHGRFTIVRSVRAIVGNREDYEALKPSAPYVPRHKGPKRAEKRIVEGIPPPSLNAVEWVRKLPEAEIPKQLLSILAMKSVDDIVNELKHNVIRGDLSPELYGLYFKTLLWVEEHRMGIDLQMFDIPNASLTPKGSLFSLRVPGLAEKRPSVLIGDRIIVQRGEDQSGKWFEGHVHAVDQLEVHLRFHGSFPKPAPTQRFHVRFKLNRIPLRRQHQAMDTSFMSDRILFPNESHTGTVGDNDNVPITPYNELIATNLPQSRAVRIGVDLPAGAPPLLIYGPAGTGKTSTIVELIKQILTKYPSARILACAPSNSAADLIASRLSSLGTDQLFRFYASSRFVRTVPVELLPFTHINANGHFSHHSLEKMCTYRVLVTTCVSASVAYGIGMPRGHFSHIFVDEAGHATEPEAMVSIKTMADSKTNIILSGDPKQLGPIIRSPVARRLGLDKSFIERLLDLDIYQNLRDGLTVVKLLKNYRSHPAILSYPNERFYDGELEPCGDPQVINTFIGNPLLVSKTFPIVFHAMAGEDAREASSPSYFNVEEVLQVKAYVEALLADQTVEIGMFSSPGSDIGIITPYHAQVQKIRKALKGVVEGVTVGSVEEFQGQERLVIIMSTVRSSQDLVEFDLRHTLGFVANPRRFNVAVTRAKALLIVVGDPTVLSLDPLWRGFLNYVYLNDGWKGVPISWDPNEPVREEGGYDAELRAQGVSDITAFAERMQNLTLQGVASGEVGDEDANEDQPWVEPE